MKITPKSLKRHKSSYFKNGSPTLLFLGSVYVKGHVTRAIVKELGKFSIAFSHRAQKRQYRDILLSREYGKCPYLVIIVKKFEQIKLL